MVAGRPASAQSRVGWLPRGARRRAPDLRGRVSRSGSPRARPREGQAALLAPPRPAAIALPSRSPVCGAWLVQLSLRDQAMTEPGRFEVRSTADSHMARLRIRLRNEG